MASLRKTEPSRFCPMTMLLSQRQISLQFSSQNNYSQEFDQRNLMLNWQVCSMNWCIKVWDLSRKMDNLNILRISWSQMPLFHPATVMIKKWLHSWWRWDRILREVQLGELFWALYRNIQKLRKIWNVNLRPKKIMVAREASCLRLSVLIAHKWMLHIKALLHHQTTISKNPSKKIWTPVFRS